MSIRAQAVSKDSTDNNTASTSEVQIDAQRMVGVNQWESNNSRADLLIEDVRILDTQITKDITIAMVETDPGHVDYGVYFDQLSLRATNNASSTLTLEVMDTRSNAAGTGPLKDNPYNGFQFYVNGKLVKVASTAIDNALTYAELKTAITDAVKAVPELANFTVDFGRSFTVSDTLGSPQTGTTITLTSTKGEAVTTPAPVLAGLPLAPCRRAPACTPTCLPLPAPAPKKSPPRLSWTTWAVAPPVATW